MTLDRKSVVKNLILLSISLFVGVALAGCQALLSQTENRSGDDPAGLVSDRPPTYACAVTEPLWVKPPDDSAVSGTPEHGYYYVNDDRSIWASAWWHGESEIYLRAGEKGVKVGWFRPAGEDLLITGERIDADAPPLEAHAPCCYPTRFQASGLAFPTEGCWEITATAANRELVFTVRVAPEPEAP